MLDIENPFLSPGSYAPVLNKKLKTNTRKIQKILKTFPMVENLMREVRPNFHMIWTTKQLSVKKDKFEVYKTVYSDF